MSAKPKASEEQIIEKLMDIDTYPSYYKIANSLGLDPQNSFIKRCHKIEERLGIPPREKCHGGGLQRKVVLIEQKPKEHTKPKPEPKLVTELARTVVKAQLPQENLSVFPFGPNEQVYYDDRLCTAVMVTAEKAILRRNADMKHITLMIEQYTENPEIVRRTDEKPPLKTTGEAIVLKQRDEGKAYIEDAETAETAKDFEPFDLEMDDNTDAVKDFGPLFDNVDYIDEEWGASPVEKLAGFQTTFNKKVKKFVNRILGR
jgi:hypothetical protein